MRWGRHLKVLELRAKHQGGKFTHLDERPKLKFGDQEYLDAYYFLHSSRHYDAFSGVPQPVSIADIAAWLDLIQEYDAGERMRYVKLITRIDRAHIDHIVNSKTKA